MTRTREHTGIGRYYSFREIEQEWGISRWTLYHWRAAGRLEVAKIGRTLRVSEQVLLDLVRRNTIPPRTDAAL